MEHKQPVVAAESMQIVPEETLWEIFEWANADTQPNLTKQWVSHTALAEINRRVAVEVQPAEDIKLPILCDRLEVSAGLVTAFQVFMDYPNYFTATLMHHMVMLSATALLPAGN